MRKGQIQASDAVPAWTTGDNAARAVVSPAVCAVMRDKPVKVKDKVMDTETKTMGKDLSNDYEVS